MNRNFVQSQIARLDTAYAAIETALELMIDNYDHSEKYNDTSDIVDALFDTLHCLEHDYSLLVGYCIDHDIEIGK